MEISDKSLKKIGRKLNDTLSNLLWGGTSNPGSAELEASAVIFETLKLLNLKVNSEKDIREILEKENVFETNFIEGL